MTDKLADALKEMVRVYFDETLTAKETDRQIDNLMHNVYPLTLAHEAAKAATPDDVKLPEYKLEAVIDEKGAYSWAMVFKTPKDRQDFINAALRQGVTLPMEVVTEDELFSEYYSVSDEIDFGDWLLKRITESAYGLKVKG